MDGADGGRLKGSLMRSEERGCLCQGKDWRVAAARMERMERRVERREDDGR